MKWTEERHGGDKGYRADGFYVGVTRNKTWRLWWLDKDTGKWNQTADIFDTPDEAKDAVREVGS